MPEASLPAAVASTVGATGAALPSASPSLPDAGPFAPLDARPSVRTVSELHDRVLAAAEQTLNRYLAELSRQDVAQSLVLPSALAKLVETTLKLQAGIDKEPSPQAADLDTRKAEAQKLRQALKVVSAPNVSANLSADPEQD